MPPFILSLIGGLSAFAGEVWQIGQSKLKPPTVARRVLRAVEQLADTTLDPIPGWKDVSEERRDKIIGGLTELGVVIAEGARKKT